MKIKCEIQCKIFPIENNEFSPYFIPIWMAENYESSYNKLGYCHVKYRMIIIDDKNRLKILKKGAWWKKPAICKNITLIYEGIKFNYNQSDQIISIIQDTIDI